MSEETEFDWDGKATPYKISVLDHFAGLAMQSVILICIKNDAPPQTIAEMAYEIAEAMMTEREDMEEKKQEEWEKIREMHKELINKHR